MPFRGFLIESKSYMSYERLSKSERVRFWFRFPFAWFRFQWSGLTNACSRTLRLLARLINNVGFGSRR